MAEYSNEKFLLPFTPEERIKRIIAPTHKKFGYPFALDWYMPEGTEILCPLEGIVTGRESRYSRSGGEENFDKANWLIIQHSHEFSIYAHLMFRGVIPKIGQKVSKGDLIGYSGQTGFATYPHLHFAVYKGIEKYDEWQNIRISFSEETDRFFIDKHFGIPN